MKFKIEKEVFKHFHPKFRVGFILAKKINNKTNLKRAQHLLEEARQYFLLTSHKETKKNKYLLDPWHGVKEKLKKKAKHYHTSAERLLKRAKSKKGISSTNTLTNLTRFLSLKHMVPISVDEMSAISKEFTYNIATGKERRGALSKIHKYNLYHHDKTKVLGTNLDYWKNAKTRPKPTTKTALIHITILPPVNKHELKAIMKEAQILIRAFCGGTTTSFILDKATPQKVVKVR